MIRLKNYISWSQFSLWKSSKRQYYKRYSLGEESKPNKYFNKGKELGKYLQLIKENEDEVDLQTLAQSMSSDPLLWQIGQIVPSLDIMEDKVEVVCGEENTLSFIDSVNLENTEFLEYKTGKVDTKGNDAWDQDKVDEHDQLLFYALMYYIKSNRTEIPSCKLIWIETIEKEIEDELGNFSHTVLVYTGRVETFEREFILSELVDFEKEIIKVSKEINEFEYNELELEEDLVQRYLYLKQTIDDYKLEMDSIKESILVEMELDSVAVASSELGKFTLSNRKSWSYSNTLTEVINDTKKFIDKQKKIEQKDKIATHSVNEILSFRES